MFRKNDEPYYNCLDCSFKFQASVVNANLVASYSDFDTAYLQYLEVSPEDRLNFCDLMRYMNSVRSVGGLVLDIGCGSGKWVRYLRGESIDAYGLEPSKALFDRYLASAQYFWNSSVENLAASAEVQKFDIVTAFDVLEHVERPKEFLAAAVGMLKLGGILWISTPDAGSLPARTLGQRWHFYNKWHLSYFSASLLRSTARSIGASVIDCRRRGRRRSLQYVIGYACRYIFGVTGPALPEGVGNIALPLNTFDTMYACLTKNRFLSEKCNCS